MALAAGDQLGSYEILESIGAGGMGIVYRARDTRLRRTVALKVLPDSLAADPELMARFEREARVLASLNHPNIAQIYGIEQGAPVMELVAGKSPKGPMPFHEAWKIATQVAEALEFAHERGVVHRDLKPANIKLTPDGTVKLLDFGLAKALATKGARCEESGESLTVTMDVTQAGMILGTPAYMSPEQATGQNVGQGADIWAFGVVLYELLTGRLPFRGESASEMMAAVLHEAPHLDPIPLRARPPIVRCLDKDPKNRLRHIGDARLLLGPDTTVAPARPRHRLLAGALAITLLLLAGLSFVHFREQSPPRDEVRLSVVLPEKSRALSLAVSPDGHAIAMVLVREGKQQIWIRELAGQEPVALAGTDGAADPFWSLNSRSVAFFADAKLKTVDRSEGPVQTVCDALGVQGGTWNQNGDILLGALTLVIPKCKDPKPKPTLTPEQIVEGEKSPDIRERLIFRLDTVEGVRPSEWSGLQVGDAKTDRILIKRRMYRFKNGPPKTAKSRREVPLTPKTAALLKEYRKLLVDDRPGAWLFPSENPAISMDYRNVFRRYIKPALLRCGLGPILFT